MSLSADETRRYARHLVLKDIGGAGQQKLKAARVAVIGAGGLGSPVIAYLAAAGIGTIGVVDNDHVSISNLQRQIVHRTEDVGVGKAANAGRFVAAMNPYVSVVPHEARLTADNARTLLDSYDLVIDGTDNFETRFLINDAAVKQRLPWVYGGCLGAEGQLGIGAEEPQDARGGGGELREPLGQTGSASPVTVLVPPAVFEKEDAVFDLPVMANRG